MKINQLKKNYKIYEGDKLFIPINKTNINSKCDNLNENIANIYLNV